MANNGREQKRGVPRPSPLSLFIAREQEEVVSTTPRMTRTKSVTASSNNKKRSLSKQLSMKETTREVKWEKQRRQIQRQRSNMGDAADHVCTANSMHANAKGVTDEDLDELKGSMELGFGFNEENGGQNLCDTLPALDLYFAVNRQFSDPKIRASSSSKSLPSLSLPTRSSSTFSATASPAGSPTAQPSLLDSLQICSPGENPQLMKTRLRQWAQVVACSVKHSS